MSELCTKSFRWEHLDDLGPPVVPRMATLLAEVRSVEAIASVVEGQSRTVYAASGRPVAAWGILPMWESVGSLWIWFTPEARKSIRSLLVIGNGELDMAHEILGYERIQVEIESSLVTTRKMATMAGFEYEGLMKGYGRYGHGDYWLMARTH